MYGNDNSFSEGYIIGRDSNGNNGNSNGWNDGFGNSAWWIIILLIFSQVSPNIFRADFSYRACNTFQ